MSSAALNIPGAFGVHMPPYKVPTTLYQDNRARLVASFKEKVETPCVLLFKSGESEMRNDSDHEPVFRQESFFSHLFGVIEPDCYAAIDTATGKATLFVPRLPKEYEVWMGPVHPPSHFASKYDVEEALYVDQVPEFLEQKAAPIHIIYGLNTDSGTEGPPRPDFKGCDKFTFDTSVLREVAVEVRVHKSKAEVEVLRKVNDLTSDAHLAVMRDAKPGMYEFQLESMFRHHCYYNGGCRNAAYTSICGCGPNASVLHYGHAGAPNDRLINDGDSMLLDMGVELNCYCSDITCAFPCSESGKFTDDQRFIFETVALCQVNTMKAAGPGVEWSSLHEIAYKTICERFLERGLLVGTIEQLMEANIGSYFMPHGLGHLIGVDTHDVGGYTKDSVRDERAGFKSLRLQRPLEPGMVVTIEPGVYFIPYLLDELLNDPVKKELAVADKLNQFRGFGGFRLEDSVHITETGIENLTTCPRTVEDVEGVIAGRITHRDQLTRLI